MLILHTVRAILRDARMHEAAGLIQAEVDKMMQDVGRLDERSRSWQRISARLKGY